MRKISRQDFIKKARLVHGDKYDYSKTLYIKANLKLTITCRSHGDFIQKANNHLTGNGCPTCANKIQMTTEEFIDKARKVHGDKYDYSKSECKSYLHKITIKCNDHGYFKQSYENHLKGMGCRVCGAERMKKQQRKLASEFISDAVAVHGGKYDYSKTTYINRNTPVTIICEQHGEFKQKPYNHLRGSGCQTCASTCFDSSKPCSLYILKSREYDFMKIGITTNFDRRLSELKCSTPFEFDVMELYSVEGVAVRDIEKVLHELSESANLQGFNGATEWFKYDGDIVETARLIMS